MTKAEAEAAVRLHGSRKAAARALRCDIRTLKQLLDPGYKRKCAPRGPRNAPTDPHVPEGHEIRGVSTLTGADGRLSSQWTKTGLEGAAPVPLPPDFSVNKVSRMYGADGTVRVAWESAERSKADVFTVFQQAAREHVEQYRGLAGTVEPPTHELDKTLTVYPFGDMHLGMHAWGPETGESNDLKISIERMLVAMRLAVRAAPPSEEAWLVNIGDALHSQNAQQATPKSGHKLDVDGRLPKVWRGALELFRALTTEALAKHGKITWFNMRGNHDPEVAFLIALWLEEAFKHDPRVEVDPALTPFVYREYGLNAFGFTHGDGCKFTKLPGIMARDRAEMWGRTKHRLWLAGHVHHQNRIDLDGCSVETLRILSPGDDWHVSHGYGAPRSMPVITFHPEEGEILRSTIDLSKIRAVLEAKEKAA